MRNTEGAIIVGAGFGGLNAAKRLANRDNLKVVLVDHRNHHLFQPLLYQVATAGLNPGRHRRADPRAVQAGAERRDSSRARRRVDLERQTVFDDDTSFRSTT